MRMTGLHLLNDNLPDRHRPHLRQQTEKQLSNCQKLKPPIDLFSPLSGDAGGTPAMTSPQDHDYDAMPEECASTAARAGWKRPLCFLRQTAFQGLYAESAGSSALVTYQVTYSKLRGGIDVALQTMTETGQV